MSWSENLLHDQRVAAAHTGTHARLLAGPGTGKTLTLTRHICFLIDDQNVASDKILALTFTRAAARELRQRVAAELGEEQSPTVSTLHSFALRQILRNAPSIIALPQPLKIADDWEERHIVLEDLRSLLPLQRINDARKLLNELSADWQSLTADESDWEKRFPNPRFLGTWREHRDIYGYTLRSELVYQLKRALEQRGDFTLEGPIEHLLVDEYQDLNRCDLAIVQHIESRNAELFIAGDDDQSIYGFRKAHPDGIRRFANDYSGVSELGLKICKRCDRSILALGLFVARQDPRRIDKTIRTEAGAEEGEIALLRFGNQVLEAKGIAQLCSYLVTRRKLNAGDILILLRSDWNGAFSRPIRHSLEEADIAVAATAGTMNPLDEKNGRAFLSFLRLAVSTEDSLAWRTLFEVWCSGVGRGSIDTIYELARSRGENLAETVAAAHADKDILPMNHRTRLSGAIGVVLSRLEVLFPADIGTDYDTCDDLVAVIQSAVELIITDDDERKSVVSALEQTVHALKLASIMDVVRAVETSSESIEPEVEEDKVNILTMHRAKGLTAAAVIVVAAEDQYIPGRAVGDEVGDERRLLYVSLTRAEHHLFITYCDKRTGHQRHTGRDGARSARSLTQFLTGCQHTPQDGTTFVRDLA